jgi:uncharacterized RDD family membrane protein YckC
MARPWPGATLESSSIAALTKPRPKDGSGFLSPAGTHESVASQAPALGRNSAFGGNAAVSVLERASRGPGVGTVGPSRASDEDRAAPAPMLEYSGFWRRVRGYIVDILILVIPTILIEWPGVLGPIFSQIGSQIQQNQAAGRQLPFYLTPVSPSALALTYLAMAVLYALYFGVQVGIWGNTLGQGAVGVTVVRADDAGAVSIGRAVARAAVFWVPALLACVPSLAPLRGIVGLAVLFILLWAAWDPRKRGLHDHWAGTAVVRPVQYQRQLY